MKQQVTVVVVCIFQYSRHFNRTKPEIIEIRKPCNDTVGLKGSRGVVMVAERVPMVTTDV